MPALLATPITLWRSVAADLWRLLLLTTAVVVTVTAFAVAVRPLSSGDLGPVLAVKFMAYALVPMLQYALPFAAGFAATLAYHRLATDNEATACFAAGLSHRRVLAPAAMTGVALTGVLIVLADQAIPRLLRSMQEMVTRDAVTFMVSSVERGEPIRLGDGRRQVYADLVRRLDADPRSGAYATLLLTGVLAVEFDEEGAVRNEWTSRAAYIWLYRGRPEGSVAAAGAEEGEDDTTVVLQLRDSIGKRAGVGRAEVEDPVWAFRIAGTFKDDPKFLSFAQLRATGERPERLNWVEQQRRALAASLGERAALDGIGAALAAGEPARFADGLGRLVTLRAGGMGEYVAGKGWALLPLAPPALKDGPAVEVTTRTDAGSGAGAGGNVRVRTQRARRAFLSPQGGGVDAGGLGGAALSGGTVDAASAGGAGTMTIVLEEVLGTATGAGAGAEGPSGQLARYPISGLRAEVLGAVPPDAPSAELIARARALPPSPAGADQPVRDAARLERTLAQVRNEVVSKAHERVAYASACLVMVLLGAIMALRLRDALPLAVYLWSFLPALACLLSISAGQRLTHQHGAVGLTVLWGGVAALLVYTVWQYRTVARH